MKVLLVWGRWRPHRCGLTDYTRTLAVALRAQGANVEIAAAGLPTDFAIGEPSPISLGTSWGPVAALRLLARARATRPDAVSFQYAASGYGRGGGLVLALALRRLAGPGTRWVVTFHEIGPPPLFPGASRLGLPRKALALVVRLADAAVTTNERYARDLRVLASRPVSVVPIGSNVSVMAEGSGSATGARFVCFGLFRRGRGLETLLDAFALLAPRHPTARLVFAGSAHPDAPGYVDELRRRSVDLGIGDRVEWREGLSPGEVSRVLAAADACVLPVPGGVNGNSGSLMAAIAHGLPVIATRGPDVPRNLDDAFLLVEPDAGNLAAAMDSVAASPALRERLRGGTAALRPLFDWDEIARALLASYGARSTKALR